MEWWQALRGRPFYWVLDGSDPAASYYMLRYVVERPDKSRARQAARLKLMQWDQVALLKARLQEAEIPEWDRAYAGPLWALRLLAEWGHPGDDEAIATALDWALDRDAAGAHPYGKELMLHIGAAFGFASDERVRALMNAVVQGLSSPAVKPERVALAAMAFAAIPPDDLDSGTVTPIERALAARLAQGHYRWDAFGYPTYDRPDGLTVAESALRLGLRGLWLDPWISQIVEAQDEHGLWRAARTHPPVEGAKMPSRWVSAKALYVLRAYYGEGKEKEG